MLSPSLSDLANAAPLRILLLDASGKMSLSLAGLVHPMRLAAGELGPQRLQLEVKTCADLLTNGCGVPAHIALLVADVDDAASTDELSAMSRYCRAAPIWGGVGAGVLWLAREGAMDGARTALPWSLYSGIGETAQRAILTPNLFEIDGNRLSCCGGAASVDFGLTLIAAIYGRTLQAVVMESLYVDRARGAGERQRMALQARFDAMQPRLAEALALMEANIEEPIATDDIAHLVGLSRRQLERQFKQYLNKLPSRYYLELRLQQARRLLRESNQSVVQVGLMCGFSSASHFSTTYGALFGMTPREERQRRLHSI